MFRDPVSFLQILLCYAVLFVCGSVVFGCKEAPLTAAQEQIARELANTEKGDFITAESSIQMVTYKAVNSAGAVLFGLEYCPGSARNPERPENLAPWTNVKRVPRGTAEYLPTLDAWLDQNPNCE